jgi:putative (di)nucleoside polyphosphate hydrolase
LRITFSYRRNVVGVILNEKKEILLVSPWWSETTKWQFPQGGVDKGESDQNAILREMHEELGTDKLEIIHYWENSYEYDWPKWYQLLRGYKGQKQSMFQLSFIGENTDIDIEMEGELSKWMWSTKSDVINNLAPSRKSIGKIALNLLD